MQNSLIWKSIEALCDEAESVIKGGDDLMAVIQSTAPPALANERKYTRKAVSVLSSEPAPPRANIIDRPNQNQRSKEATRSPATMAEIATAIERASQSAQKTEKIEQSSQTMGNKLQQDLIAEISQAVRNVIANELPQMVHHAISESLSEIITQSVNPELKNTRRPKTNSMPKNRNKKASTKQKPEHASASKKRVKIKKVSTKADT